MTGGGPIVYPSLRACRTDDEGSFTCRAAARWIVDTVDRNGVSYTDQLCGRHLAGFLTGCLGHGQSATVIADYGYGKVTR